jgi:hypothetical protein
MSRKQPLTPRNRGDVPPPQSEKAEMEKSDLKKPSFWVAVITLVVISGYTYFAHQQVTETQTANGIAKKALAEANKPYVMYSTIYPNHTSDKNGTHLRIGFSLVNFGNTPASYLRFTNCDPIIVDGGVAPNLKCTVSEKPSDEFVLGPKQQVNYTGSIIKESDLDATREDKKNIYVLGYVTYQDSIDLDPYGNPEQRETRFCQKIAQTSLETVTIPVPPAASAQSQAPQPPPALQLPAGIAPIAAFGCPAFTCTDSGCPAQR